jgi:UDP-3-O-[3-hydroxymyristoyl] N-acetylglucosamine deacetylase (EC 3.5.1.-)
MPGREDFGTFIAPARTFGLADQVAQFQAQGLIRGGSLANALVCDRERGWLNPPLRFADEPVRHKMLDFLGDLGLLGALPRGHFLAYKAGHRLHIQLAHRLTVAA